jgi:hypothetical protein
MDHRHLSSIYKRPLTGLTIRYYPTLRAHPSNPCRGAWARVTIDRFRHLALQTFYGCRGIGLDNQPTPHMRARCWCRGGDTPASLSLTEGRRNDNLCRPAGRDSETGGRCGVLEKTAHCIRILKGANQKIGQFLKSVDFLNLLSILR